MPLGPSRRVEYFPSSVPNDDISFASSVRAPERAVLINEDFSEDSDIATLPRSLEFFWNPETLRLAAGAQWARIQVPGLSHEVLQWSHNKSREIEFTLQWSAMEAAKRYNADPPTTPTMYPRARTESQRSVYLYRDFLHALIAPLQRGRAPSRISLIWVNVLQITGVVTDIDFDMTSFTTGGEIRALTANVSMLELRTTFLGRKGVFGYFIQNAWTPEGEADARGISIEEALYGDW